MHYLTYVLRPLVQFIALALLPLAALAQQVAPVGAGQPTLLALVTAPPAPTGVLTGGGFGLGQPSATAAALAGSEPVAVPGLAFLARLRPAAYRLGPEAPLRTGFLAPAPTPGARSLRGDELGGLPASATAPNQYGPDNAQLVGPLVRAVQELNTQVATLRAMNSALRGQNVEAARQAAVAATRLRNTEAQAAQATEALADLGRRLALLEALLGPQAAR